MRAQLLQEGIDAWLDKYDFEPFLPWQDQLETIISQIKAAAIFIGSSGVGPWADIEMKEFLVEFVQRKLRMGLVILPGCPDELINTVPRFMKRFHCVDFRQPDPEPMGQLIWGITGNKPRSNAHNSGSITNNSAEARTCVFRRYFSAEARTCVFGRYFSSRTRLR
ncbi:TIR domain-containing protein [Nostoc commune]|uniref:TIR domain-containing protein n=1 Tax=Nostoc commune TaxID=1178 RepID=UPI00396A4FAC